MTHTTTAITFYYRIHREYDRIYTVYSRHAGKQNLLARGSNKILSKLAGHIEPCVLSSLMIAEGNGWDILAQARSIKSFKTIRQDPNRFYLASICMESLDKLTHIEERDEEVFDLLLTVLNRIETMEFKNEEVETNLIYHYLLHLLIHLGHAPDMRHQEILNTPLVADILEDDIIISAEAKVVIEQYLMQALDGVWTSHYETALHKTTKNGKSLVFRSKKSSMY